MDASGEGMDVAYVLEVWEDVETEPETESETESEEEDRRYQEIEQDEASEETISSTSGDAGPVVFQSGPVTLMTGRRLLQV